MTAHPATGALDRMMAALPGHTHLWQRDDAAAATLPGYTVEVHLRDPSRLVVCFDSRAESYDPSQTRPAWAYGFLEKRGLSAVHVKPDQSCWYRQSQVADLLTAARDAGLFAAFDTVMTYGGSMGGFGALSFAATTQATTCLALNPQANLGPDVRAWETRYPEALDQDWTGPLCDLGTTTATTANVICVLDPRYMPDRRQVELINNPHMTRLHIPFVRHRIPAHINALQMLKQLFADSLAGAVDPVWFRTQARRRRTLLRYRNEMLRRTQDHPTRRARLDRLLPPEDGLLGGP